MGLQVEGSPEVSKIVCGVSASRDLFERAAEAGAQLVLVHHGLFWDNEPRVITRGMRERLRVLFDDDLTLAAYHLALDAHSELGNNALLCRELGIEPEARFAGLGLRRRRSRRRSQRRVRGAGPRAARPAAARLLLRARGDPPRGRPDRRRRRATSLRPWPRATTAS